MGAPEGNEFWKLRSKHGRKKIFETPDIMLEAACEYFQWCVDNPLKEEVLMKRKTDKDYETIEHETVSKIRPFTMQGLCLFLDVNTVYFNHFEESLKGKEDDLSNDFSKIVIRIREIIYNQKFTGAASGFFNSNIIARDLGLKDRSDVTSNDKELKEQPIITKVVVKKG